MKFRIYFMALLSLVVSVAFNTAVGATLGSIVAGNALAGAGIANGIALCVGDLAPKGALRVGLLREVWTGEMIKALRTTAESLGWYDRIRSYDQYVDNDVIHFTEIGGDPEVLVNNKSYPLDIQTLEDADKPVSLDKFDTKPTSITDDELHACSYDKISSTIERHRDALREKKHAKAIHAIAPDKHVDNSAPVLFTTGEASGDGKRKQMTTKDLLTLKRQFDAMGVPKADRILVLCSDHINDLLESDTKFAGHYNINQTEGKIARLYGFDIYEYDNTPYYTVSTKKIKPFGAVPDDNDRQASVAFYSGRMMKANGSLEMYYSEAKTDPLNRRNLVGFRQWSICLPLTEGKCRMAMVSAKA